MLSYQRTAIVVITLLISAPFFLNWKYNYNSIDYIGVNSRQRINPCPDEKNTLWNMNLSHNLFRSKLALTFDPGTIDISRIGAVKSCINGDQYPIIQKFTRICALSKEYKVVHLLVPKSGSSTLRSVMKHDLGAQEYTNCSKIFELDGVFKQVAVRHPVDRFYAAFDEMFLCFQEHPNNIPTSYSRFMEPFHGMRYSDVAKTFNTQEGIKKMTDAVVKFVESYDGKIIFDPHIASQMPILWNVRLQQGDSFDLIMDTHYINQTLLDLNKRYGKEVYNPTQKRSSPRRFNQSALSDKIVQKICRLYALDFCCLNFKLPEPCLAPSIPKGERVTCEWLNLNGELRIRPILI